MNYLKSSFGRVLAIASIALFTCFASQASAADFTAAIAGRVFCDENCNGQIDIGVDDQLMNVTVQLYNGNGQLVATTTPAVYNGVYIFPDLVVGQSYYVRVVPSMGQSVINAFPSQNAVKINVRQIRATVVQADTTYYPNDFLLKCCCVTFTQCSWGYNGCGFSPIDLIWCNFDELFPNGCEIGGNKKLKFTSPNAILRFLPSSGSPKALYQSRTNPTSDCESRFAGNVLALTLNVKLSDKGITSECLSEKEMVTGKLAGWSVGEILELANKVLGGDLSCLPSGLTVTGLNSILDDINENNLCGWNSSGCTSYNDNGYCRKRRR